MNPAHSPADRLPGDAEIYGERHGRERALRRATDDDRRLALLHADPPRQEQAERSNHRADRSNPVWTLVKAFSVHGTKQIDTLGARAPIARQAKGDAQYSTVW
jgi:hypothetical protein